MYRLVGEANPFEHTLIITYLVEKDGFEPPKLKQSHASPNYMSGDLQSPALATCLLFYIKWCRVAYPLSVYRHFIPHIATNN